MREQLRKAWAEIIQPDDYEAHMAAVGQAQANAHLVAEFLRTQWSKPDASILFVGAGTGQMFDFISPELLFPFSLTFTDINAGYLQRLAARLAAFAGLRYKTLVDDLESTRISCVFNVTAAILVLEHVDWRKAVSTLCALTTHEALVVIQENPPDFGAAMTPGRQVPGSMKIFTEIHPELVPVVELEFEFASHNFQRSYSAHKIVADGKRMLALSFVRNAIRPDPPPSAPTIKSFV